MHSRIEAIDFDTSEIDAAICVGGGEWPGLSALALHTEELVVIASAQLSPIERDDAEGLENAMERANTIQRIIH